MKRNYMFAAGLLGGLRAAALLGAMTPTERMMGRYMRDGNGHPEGVNAEQLATQVKALFQKSFDEVKSIAETAVGDAKKTGEM